MGWTLLLWVFIGCGLELPSKPPDLLHKFNVLEVGRGPAHLLTTDFNMDGNADLISANSKNSTLSVMLGKGDGTFQKTLTFPVATEPTAVVTNDINRDGIPDLIANARGADRLTVLLGNGNGSFNKLPSVRTGRVPLAIIPADFNADGKLDLAVTLTFDKMEIFLGSGDGFFRRGKTYLTGSRSLSGVAEDFDKDGKIDLALATSSSNTSSIRFYRGNGDGTFAKSVQIAHGLVPLTLIKKDMNNDGRPDLVFAAGQGDNLYMLLSLENGTFEKAIAFSGGGGPIALVADHFNTDNLVDVAVANSRSSSFSLVLRRADGSFHYPTRDYIIDGGTPLAITSGDYNTDGMMDIAVASNAKSTVEIYLQRRVFQ
tara:strand:+ start:1315 stop:2427 length:1113 start_codon:yes stop_codon:yes gene_type:complete